MLHGIISGEYHRVSYASENTTDAGERWGHARSTPDSVYDSKNKIAKKRNVSLQDAMDPKLLELCDEPDCIGKFLDYEAIARDIRKARSHHI